MYFPSFFFPEEKYRENSTHLHYSLSCNLIALYKWCLFGGLFCPLFFLALSFQLLFGFGSFFPQWKSCKALGFLLEEFIAALLFLLVLGEFHNS